MVYVVVLLYQLATNNVVIHTAHTHRHTHTHTGTRTHTQHTHTHTHTQTHTHTHMHTHTTMMTTCNYAFEALPTTA